jgi:hypothetical protein
VSKIVISGSPTLFHLKHLSQPQNYGAIIIAGSIPPPSHLFIRNETKVILIVHEFIYHETGNAIAHGRFKEKLGAAYYLICLLLFVIVFPPISISNRYWKIQTTC